jgi:hypothetical protein
MNNTPRSDRTNREWILAARGIEVMLGRANGRKPSSSETTHFHMDGLSYQLKPFTHKNTIPRTKNPSIHEQIAKMGSWTQRIAALAVELPKYL